MVLAPTFAVIRAAFGLGRYRIACIAIVGALALLLSVLIAATVAG